MNTKKIEELEQTIKQAQAQIEELKKEDETPMFEYPRIGQKVWMINEYGNIDWFVWRDTEIGKNMAHLGMLFFTKEEAEFEAERRRVIAELKLFAEPEDRIWNRNTAHFKICLDIHNNSVIVSADFTVKCNIIYFESEEIAQKAIDKVGEDRVKKYYLRIEGETEE